MIGKTRFAVVYLLLVLSGLYLVVRSEGTVPVKRPFSEFPVSCNGWRMIHESRFDEKILAVLKSSDYLSRTYMDAERVGISLYIGYHGDKGSGEIHSPKHCLPGSGWYKVSSRTEELQVGDRSIRLVNAVYQKGEAREMFLYWYQVGERTVANEYVLKAAQIINSMVYGRTGSTFVRVSVPVRHDEQQAHAAAVRFIRDIYPFINRFIPT